MTFQRVQHNKVQSHRQVSAEDCSGPVYSCLLSTVYCLLSTVYCLLLSTVHYCPLLSTVYCLLLSTVHYCLLLSTVYYCLLSTTVYSCLDVQHNKVDSGRQGHCSLLHSSVCGFALCCVDPAEKGHTTSRPAD